MNKKKLTHNEARQQLSDWIRHQADRTGFTDEKIARLLGVSQSSFNKLKNGKRSARYEEAAILSQIFDATLPAHLTLANQHPVRKSVSLRLNIAANVWRKEAAIMSTSRLSINALPSEEYDNLEQFAHYVEDEHASSYIPKGYFVICVDYHEARKTPQHGDIVIIKRLRLFSPDGNEPLTETSIRRIVKKGNAWALESLGTPSLEPVEIPYDGETKHLKISGLAIARYAEG